MKNSLLILALLFISLKTFAQKNAHWKLIYHNDKSGKAIKGKIDYLIEAVRNGEQVRIYWHFQHPTKKEIKVEHFTNAKFFTIMSDKTVLAQIDPIVGQKPDFSAKTITLKENLEWSFIASTTGKCDTMTRNMHSGEVVDHKFMNYEIKWYVEK